RRASMLDLPRESWTLVHAVRVQAGRMGERPFLTFQDGSALDFGELDRGSDRIASALAGLGVRSGDRVLALARNSAPFLLAMLGTQKRGAIFAPLNTELKGAFLEHQLRNARPAAIVVDDDLRAAFDTVDASGVGVAHTIVIGDGPTPPVAGSAAVPFSALLDTPVDADALVTPRPKDVAMIMYTSGTTGPSKGVLMPHGHCYLFGLGLARAIRLTAEDRYYICMPLFHANALLLQLVGCLLTGTPAHVARRFSASTWLEEVRSAGATVTNALGVMPEFIFRQPPTARDREHRLRLIMAVPIADEWGAAFEARFGVRFFQGFGMTECNVVAYSDPADPILPGCAGPVLSEWFEVAIVDPDTDESMPADSVGEIAIRPRLASCFSAGYHAMPERTVEAWRNLWFHTGDAGRLDARGRLWFVDRIKDCIRRRGENISSFEIEQVLNAHPAVAESAVVGVRVAGAGGEEEVKACIVPAGESPDPADVLGWCASRMPRYAVPRFLEFVPALEKTATGKIRKQDLRNAGVTPATWDREATGFVVPR
ncbi:MAG TPA: AMP-binding protein, partial [Candidatus Binatia bacterium]|nr:AMP-binding protein [Candidatus Binatia bacterium]